MGRAPVFVMTDPFSSGLPRLSTPRLVLRQPVEADVPAFRRVFGSSEDLKYWSHGPLADDAAVRDYLNSIRSGVEERRLFQWAVTLADTDQMIGTCTLTSWDRDNRHADIGFILARAFWGRGYAREAVHRVLTFGFEAMDLHRVEADVHPENEASLRLLESLGFVREGLLRERWCTFGAWEDSVLLGLLRRDLRLQGKP